MTMNSRIFFLLILLPGFTFSQTKIQSLYESNKYEKCIKLCEENIKNGVEKQKSYLFKALVLLQSSNEKFITKSYEYPAYEAVKSLKKIETYHQKNPKDSFYKGFSRQIKQIIRSSNEYADSLYYANDQKYASRILKKLNEVYPKDPVYIFKLARLHKFDLNTFPKFYSLNIFFQVQMQIIIQPLSA